MGLVEAQQSEGAKKLFAITDAGTAELEANRESADRLIARLTDIGAERQRTDSASVRRAMGNLKTVLMNRLGERDLDEATRSDEHTSELQSLMRTSYAVFCLKNKK